MYIHVYAGGTRETKIILQGRIRLIQKLFACKRIMGFIYIYMRIRDNLFNITLRNRIAKVWNKKD